MDSKIIKKILAYAKQYEIPNLSITSRDGKPLLVSEDSLIKHQIKLPAEFATELGLAYRRLLSLAPNDLVSGAYFKDQDSAFKISIIPDTDGERIIINTIAKSKRVLSISKLGLGRQEQKIIEAFIKRRRGLIVIGSSENQGKTTTLYSLLQKIDKEERSCYLLEEYSELELDELNKIISSGAKRVGDLHRILKSDSEIIAIDDANDELLTESYQAATSGRLVIATLNSDTPLHLVERIKKITNSEDCPILLIYQKLLNKNCPYCLKAYIVNESEELIAKYWPEGKKYKPSRFFSSAGCSKCHHSGVSGQIASFNLIEINRTDVNILSTLASDVLEKAANGLISISKFISESKSGVDKKL